MAEIALLLGGILGAAAMMGAIISMARVRGPYARGESAALGRSQRAALVRVAFSVLAALVVFGAAVVAHMVFPLWQGVSFLVGPALGTAAGLIVFVLFPAVPIEGAVDRQVASLERRSSRTLASPMLRWTFIGSAVLTIAVIVACGSISSAAPDGRFLCTALFDVPCLVGGPYLFPGWYFGVPTIVAVVLLALSIVLAFQRVIVSPGASWPELAEADRVLRENAARLILCIGIAPLMLTVGMLLAAGGLPLFNAPALNTGLTVAAAQRLSTLGLVLMLAAAAVILVGLVFTIAAVIRGINVGSVTRRRHESGSNVAGQTI